MSGDSATVEAVPTFGGTTEIDEWVAAGKALPVGGEPGWASRPDMSAQWRRDLNAGLDISVSIRTVSGGLPGLGKRR